MKIKSKKLSYAGLFIVAAIICNSIVFAMSGDDVEIIKGLGVICLIELFFFALINKTIAGRILNFSLVFVIVLFVFNFGQVMILTFFHKSYSHIRFLLLMSSADALYGFRLIFLAFSCVCSGILISECVSESEVNREHEIRISNMYNWKTVAKNIILFTFPVKVGLDIATLIVCITEGGKAARYWLNSFPNVILYYGKISLIGFAILLICLSKEPKKQLRLLVGIELYLLIVMISGIRSENVAYVLIFAFLYVSTCEKKINVLRTILLCIVGFFSLTFVVTIGDFRLADDRSISSLFEIYNSYLNEKNVLLGLLDNLGDTGYTALCVLTKWFPNHSPSWGTAYYLGWTAIIPSIFGLAGQITNESCFPLKLQASSSLSSDYYNIGGSLIGEQFFNFGIIGGLIACFVIGYFLGWVSRKYIICIREKRYAKLTILVPIMFASIYWIRDYFGGEIREIVWGVLFCYLIRHTIKNCRAKRRYYEKVEIIK